MNIDVLDFNESQLARMGKVLSNRDVFIMLFRVGARRQTSVDLGALRKIQDRTKRDQQHRKPCCASRIRLRERELHGYARGFGHDRFH